MHIKFNFNIHNLICEGQTNEKSAINTTILLLLLEL